MTKDNDLLKELKEEDAGTSYIVKKAEKSEAEKEYDERIRNQNVTTAEPIEEPPVEEPEPTEKSSTTFKEEMSAQRAYAQSENESEPKSTTVKKADPKPTIEADPESTSETEPETEPEETLPPTPIVDDDIENRIKELEKIVKDVITAMFSKDDKIEALTKANIELILIDMQTIADELNRADELTGDIGTEEQIENVQYEEKHRGANLALAAAKRHIEHDGSNAKKVEHIHEALRMDLNKLNERLKYISEA